MRIGVFGGSFNPVHCGHLALAESAFSQLNLSHVYFVPSFQPPLKSDKDLLPASFRVQLLKKSLKTYPDFSVSTCEIDRGGKSYTVDTLNFFRRKVGKNAKIYFLAGLDSLKNLSQWKSVEKIFKLCNFVVASRPGFQWENTHFPVLQLPFEALDVSSSGLRKRLRAKKSVQDLVPKAIAADLKKYFSK